MINILGSKFKYGNCRKFISNIILPDEHIIINNNILLLRSIVVHNKLNHYKAFFKSGNTWFLYNDDPYRKKGHTVITPIGKYTNLIKIKEYNNIANRSTILLYVI